MISDFFQTYALAPRIVLVKKHSCQLFWFNCLKGFVVCELIRIYGYKGRVHFQIQVVLTIEWGDGGGGHS